jgi:hypothetical protein
MKYNTGHETVGCRDLCRSRLDASGVYGGVSHDIGQSLVAASYANVVQCPEMYQYMSLREIDMHPKMLTKTWLKMLEHPIATPRTPAKDRPAKTDVSALVIRMRVRRRSRKLISSTSLG